MLAILFDIILVIVSTLIFDADLDITIPIEEDITVPIEEDDTVSIEENELTVPIDNEITVPIDDYELTVPNFPTSIYATV